MDISPFEKIAKYLKHPLVLAGFALFLFYAFAEKAITLPILSQITGDATAGILMAALDKIFWLALPLIAGGLGLQFTKHFVPSAKQRLEHSPTLSGDALLAIIEQRAHERGLETGRQASAAEIAQLSKTIDDLRRQAAEKGAPKGLAAALAAAEQSGDTQAVEILLSRVAEEKAADAKTAARDAARDLRRAATLARWRDTRQALTYLRRATEIAPDDVKAWIERARLETQAGDTAAAQESYRRSEVAALACGDQRLIAMAALGSGEMALRSGKTSDGVAELRRAYDALEKLAAADPSNAQAQRDLSISHEKIGDALMITGDAAGALKAYREHHKIAEKLADADPSNAQAQRDLSISHGKIGDALMKTGDAAGALKAYRDSFGIRQKRAAADPGDAQAQRDLLVSNFKLSEVTAADEKTAHLRQALAIAQRLAAESRLAPADAWMVAELERRLAAD